MKTRTIIKIGTAVVPAAGIGLAAVGNYLFKSALRRGGFFRNTEASYDGNKTQSAEMPENAFHEAGKWWTEQSSGELEIQSHDGLKLVAYHLPCIHDAESRKVAILSHGYSGSGLQMTAFARIFNELGFHVIMPDGRGHGKSEGDYIGMGWLDQPDYLQWIDQAIELYGEECQIVLMGISMGGATVTALTGQALVGNVKCVIEDCGYTSVRDIFTHQMKRYFHLPPFPVLQAASLITKIKAGYYFGEASMVKMVEKSDIPILFIHGEKDTFVPVEMVFALHEAAVCEKDIWVVKGAAHGMAYNTEPETYRLKVKNWVEKFVV